MATQAFTQVVIEEEQEEQEEQDEQEEQEEENEDHEQQIPPQTQVAPWYQSQDSTQNKFLNPSLTDDLNLNCSSSSSLPIASRGFTVSQPKSPLSQSQKSSSNQRKLIFVRDEVEKWRQKQY